MSNAPTKRTTEQNHDHATKNDHAHSSLLHNSLTYFEQFRQLQSKFLAMRLNVFKKAAIAKYGSIDKIKTEGGSPIESKTDIEIIERLIDLKTFVTIPVYTKANNSVTHFYTLGMWYYWGLPELVISFKNPVRENIEFVNTITNIIHDELFHVYKDRLSNTSEVAETIKCLNRIDFELEPDKIKLTLDKFDLEYDLKRVDLSNYMELKAGYMMWFYMYYMDATTDEKGQPKMYPVYQVNIDEGSFRTDCKKVLDALMKSAVELSSMAIPSSDDQSDTSNSDTESMISEEGELDHEDCDMNKITEDIENLDLAECSDRCTGSGLYNKTCF